MRREATFANFSTLLTFRKPADDHALQLLWEGEESMSVKPLIVIGKDRVCHVCQLGSRLDERVIGALVIYLGLEHDVTVHRDAGTQTGRIVAVEPYARHRIVSGRQHVCTILVEPESVTDTSLNALRSELNHPATGTAVFGDLLDFIHDAGRNPATMEKTLRGLSFDRLIFDGELEKRPVDQRISQITELLDRETDGLIGADYCGRQISLTASRFRRLFRETTGVQFRNYRMWRRARSYLRLVKEQISLTQTALELGYPDSTHFSHSIRHTYGLPPRQMKTHMEPSIFFLMDAV